MSLSAFAVQWSNETQKPRRFIILIHGLGGSLKTFGHLPSLLKEHGEMVQPDIDFRIIPIQYETGKDQYSTYDFAKDLGDDIVKQVGKLRPTDQITIVAHSQGGLIAWIWYLISIGAIDHPRQNEFKNFRPFALKTEGLMTLGSPIWGSKLATFLNNFKPVLKVARNFGTFMGQKEIEEMSYTSDTILRFRYRARELDESGYQLPLRMSSVAGALPRHTQADVPFKYQQLLKFFEKFLGSGTGQIAESDVAVAVPSARADFIYLKSDQSQKDFITPEDFSHFQNKNLGDFQVIQGIHANPSGKDFYDIAEVPKVCRNLEKPCTHPTYGLIFKFTMECTPLIENCSQDKFQEINDVFFKSKDWLEKRSLSDYATDNLHTFILDLVIDLPEDYSIKNDKEYLLSLIKFYKDNQGRIRNNNPEHDRYYFILQRPKELFSVVTAVTDFRLSPTSKLKKQIRISYHGQIHPLHKDANQKIYNSQVANGFRLPFKIQLPGQRQKMIEVLIKPTYTTFLNVEY